MVRKDGKIGSNESYNLDSMTIAIVEALEKSTTHNRTNLGEISGHQGKLVMLTQRMNQNLGMIQKIQQSTLSRGLDLSELMDKSVESSNKITHGVNTLGAGLAGYGVAMEVASDMFHAGLNTNNKEMAVLVLANRVTSQTSAHLAKVIRKNTVGAGLTQEQLSNLATTALGLQETFGVTGQELNEAIERLGESLDEFVGLGIAEEGQIVAMTLGAVLGKGAEHMGAELLSSFTRGDKIVTRSLLGIQKQVQGFLKGGENAAELGIRAVVDGVFAAKKVAEEWRTGAGDLALSFSLANKLYDGTLAKSMRFYNEFTAKYGAMTKEQMVATLKELKERTAIQNKFTQTWETVKSKIMGPLVKIMERLIVPMLEWIAKPENDYIWKTLGSLLVVLAPLAIVLGALRAVFTTIAGTLNSLFGFFGKKGLFRGLFKKIGTKILAAPLALLGPIGAVALAVWSLWDVFTGVYKWIFGDNKKTQAELAKGNEDSAAASAKANELAAITAKNAEEEMRERKREAKGAQYTTELLRKIHEALQVESLRSEMAQQLRQQQTSDTSVIKAAATAPGKRASGGLAAPAGQAPRSGVVGPGGFIFFGGPGLGR